MVPDKMSFVHISRRKEGSDNGKKQQPTKVSSTRHHRGIFTTQTTRARTHFGSWPIGNRDHHQFSREYMEQGAAFEDFQCNKVMVNHN